MSKPKLTVVQAVFMAEKCDKLFQQAANAWVRGNNSGNNDAMRRGSKLCDKKRREAEALLAPLKIKVDYPGLYPSFTVNGFSEYSVLNAISAALEKPGKIAA